MAITADLLLEGGDSGLEDISPARGRTYRLRQGKSNISQPARSAGIIGAGFLAIFAMAHVVHQAEQPMAKDSRNPRSYVKLAALKSRSLNNFDEDQTFDSGGPSPCQAAEIGTQCYDDMLYAQRHVSAHPEWYVGLHKGSSLKAFQAFLHKQLTNTGRPRCPKPCGHAETADERMLSGRCHNADKGESCYNHVLYTMNDNLPKHPEWYPGLPLDADFKTVQAYLHKQRVCPKPCGFIEKKRKHSCHTAFAGEPCYGDVLWAMDHVGLHPEWYPGLTNESGVAEVQAFLHKQHHAHALQLCPQPCNETAVDIVEQIDEKRHCHTANPGETCYKSVAWVVEEGIIKHPEWYVNITAESTFEEVQARLHEDENTNCKSIPCPCRTAEKGEKCWESIQWVYTTGLVNHSNWYPELNSSSTMEEVQARLHSDKHPACPMPCQHIPWQVRSEAQDEAGSASSVATFDQADA